MERAATARQRESLDERNFLWDRALAYQSFRQASALPHKEANRSIDLKNIDVPRGTFYKMELEFRIHTETRCGGPFFNEPRPPGSG